jgi:hypothetical protein
MADSDGVMVSLNLMQTYQPQGWFAAPQQKRHSLADRFALPISAIDMLIIVLH